MRWILPCLLLFATVASASDLSTWSGQLGDDSGIVRYRAARALGSLGPKARSALPDLIDLLGDDLPWVRMEVARAIVRIGINERAVKPLMQRLDVAPPEITALLAEALAEQPAAIKPLTAALGEQSSHRVQREALTALRNAGRRAASAIPAVLDLTASKDAAVRKAAQETLRRLAPWSSGVVPQLIERLQTGEGDVRWLAARLLAGAGPAAKAAIPALREIAASDDAHLAPAAENALKNIDVVAQINQALFQPHAAKEKAPAKFKARFETTRGVFVIDVERALAPKGADRFYNLVKLGYYDGAHFFRVMPNFVVQFGLHANPKVTGVWRGAKLDDDPVKTSNAKGTVCYAMAGPNTRTTQLFISLGNNRGLDQQGFAPFGKVVKGMDVVTKLYSGYGQQPDQQMITMEGRAYLEREFPKLDSIKKATIEK